MQKRSGPLIQDGAIGGSRRGDAVGSSQTRPVGCASRQATPQPLSWPSLLPPEQTPTVSSLLLLRQEPQAGQASEGDSAEPSRVDVLWDEDRRCFASHWPGLIGEAASKRAFDAFLEHAPWEELTSKRGRVTRRTCWYVRNGCACDYTYGSVRVDAAPWKGAERCRGPFELAMEELLECMCEKVCPWLPRAEWPNSANLNLYVDDTESIGWHADDEALFRGRESDCPILSVSLGAAREFWLALRNPEAPAEARLDSIVEVDLRDGDVFSMEGLLQKHCLHFVPAGWPGNASKPVGGGDDLHRQERINVTWRWIRDHKPKCPLHRKESSRRDEQLFSKICTVSSRGSSAVHAAHDWANGQSLSWRSCNSCSHDAWRHGRNCVNRQGRWLCRMCWQRDPSASSETGVLGRSSAGSARPADSSRHKWPEAAQCENGVGSGAEVSANARWRRSERGNEIADQRECETAAQGAVGTGEHRRGTAQASSSTQQAWPRQAADRSTCDAPLRPKAQSCYPQKTRPPLEKPVPAARNVAGTARPPLERPSPTAEGQHPVGAPPDRQHPAGAPGVAATAPAVGERQSGPEARSGRGAQRPSFVGSSSRAPIGAPATQSFYR